MQKATLDFTQLKAMGELAINESLFTHGDAATGFLSDPPRDLNVSWRQNGDLNATVYDLSSLTKALVTTPLCLREVFSQGLSLECSLGDVFPDRAFFPFDAFEPESFQQGIRRLRLADILRHEAGLANWRNFYVICEKRGPQLKIEALKRVVKCRDSSPKNLYSDTGMILLGTLLEAAYGQSLTQLFKAFCEDELLLTPAVNGPAPGSWFRRMDCIPTGYCHVRERDLQGEVHDENAWSLGGFAGHAGLFGSLEHVKNYIRALAESRTGRLVIEANHLYAQKHQTSDSALGWRTGRDLSSQGFASGRGIGHLGFTGTAFWLDWTTKRFAIVLTNRVVMSRTSNIPAIKQFRAKAFTLLDDYSRSL